jgi:hypothetical protein
MTPVSSPIVKMDKNPRTNSIGVRSTGLPSHSVASQAKTCTPIGMEIAILAAAKKDRDISGSPVVNM